MIFQTLRSLLLAAALISTVHQGFAMADKAPLNVNGTPLIPCGSDPKTGYYRDGICATGPDDHGVHVVCAEVTKAFLEFSKSRGNDLMTPRPELKFPGLKPGNRWCLCALRWKEAFEANVAPPVVLESTHAKALEFVKLKDLRASGGSP